MSTVFSGGTSLHWANMTEMQYFVQNWVKRQERLRSITRNIGIGPCSHWLLQNMNNWQRRPETEIQGGRPISERENKNKTCTGCWPAGLVCVAPCRENATKLKITVHIHTGPQPSWGAFHTGNLLCTGTSVALLDCKRKAIHTNVRARHSKHSELVHTVHSGSSRKATKSMKSTKPQCLSERTDLVEIFTQKAQLLTFTQKSLKCSHMNEITQNP